MEEHERQILLDVLVEPIAKPVDEAVEKLGSEDLEYNLSFSPFTKNLIFGAVKGVGSIGKLIQTIRAANLTGSAGLVDAGKTSYHEAFHRYDASLFRNIFLSLATSLPLLSIPELNDLGRILLVDGSVFPAIANMSWATYQSDHNAIKLHLFFELNRMIPVNFVCTNANASEKKSLSNHIECATTYICDRGYFAFWLLAEISTKKAFFIIRGKSNMVLTVVEDYETKIPAQFLDFLSNVLDRKVLFTNDKSGNEYRVISFTVGTKYYAIVTNRFDLTTYQVIMLYAYRWQVELMFRTLKRTMNGLHLMAHHPNGIAIQFYVSMIAYLLQIHLKQKAHDLSSDTTHITEDTACSPAEIAGDIDVRKMHCVPDINTNILTPAENRKVQASSSDEFNPEGTTQQNSSRNGGKNRQYVCGLVTFLGKRLPKYFRISIHWLIALREALYHPLTPATARLLAS